METTILICFDIAEDVEVEIMLPITFIASKGYPATHEDPGCPDEICDIEYDEHEAINLVVRNFPSSCNSFFDYDTILEQIETCLESEKIDIELIDYANESARDYKEAKAEHDYDEMIARKKGLY